MDAALKHQTKLKGAKRSRAEPKPRSRVELSQILPGIAEPTCPGAGRVVGTLWIVGGLSVTLFLQLNNRERQPQKMSSGLHDPNGHAELSQVLNTLCV